MSIPTARLGLTKPQLSDAPANVETAVGTIADELDVLVTSPVQQEALAGTSGAPGAANKFVTDNDARNSNARTPTAHAASHQEGAADDIGAIPIGGQLAYTGSMLPAGTKWAWADGGLINSDIYTVFRDRTGHAYNGGVSPGSGAPTQGGGGSGPLIRLPDKRGRMLAGANTFGQGSAGAATSRAQTARGANAGTTQEQLALAHLPSHDHGGGNHYHTYNVSRGQQIYGGFLPDITWDPGIGTNNVNNSGNIITAQGSNSPHNNLPPHEADTYIVRIA
jgi:hypothetical protein